MPIDAQVASIDLARDDALGRPTIARALIAAGFADSVEDAFRRLIGWGAPGVRAAGRSRSESRRSMRSARRAGYRFSPTSRRRRASCRLLRELRDAGLRGLEVYYRTFDRDTVTLVADVAKRLGFVATGGSDYHGDLMTYAEAHATLNVPQDVGERSAGRCGRTAASSGIGRFLHVGVEVDGFAAGADAQVDQLDEDREAHGEVDVALRDVQVEAVGHQGHPDQEQEAQGEHLDRRVRLDELREWRRPRGA